MRRTFNIFSSPSQIATAKECPRPPILLCLANQVCSHFAGRVSEERASRTSGRSQILLYRRARSRGAGSRSAVSRKACELVVIEAVGSVGGTDARCSRSVPFLGGALRGSRTGGGVVKQKGLQTGPINDRLVETERKIVDHG